MQLYFARPVNRCRVRISAVQWRPLPRAIPAQQKFMSLIVEAAQQDFTVPSASPPPFPTAPSSQITQPPCAIEPRTGPSRAPSVTIVPVVGFVVLADGSLTAPPGLEGLFQMANVGLLGDNHDAVLRELNCQRELFRRYYESTALSDVNKY